MISNSTPAAKKHLGQHFLKDEFVLQRIISACQIKEDETIIEIGPGRGVLTKKLAKKAHKIIAIEKDRQLVSFITEELRDENVAIIQEDILKLDWNDLPNGSKLVGNLPYNIATPIIEKAIANKDKFTEFYFMVQREHAQRLMAKPNCKDYGSLSCYVQYHCKIKSLFNIPPQAFIPPPKVMSSFLSIKFKKSAHDKDFQKLLFSIIKQGFSQRRKMLINNLSTRFDKQKLLEIFETLKVGGKLRAENVSLKQYIDLIQHLGSVT